MTEQRNEHVHNVQVLQTPFGTLRASCVLPTPEGETFDHDLHGFCWCQPRIEERPPDGRVYIHRKSLDAPYFEDAR